MGTMMSAVMSLWGRFRKGGSDTAEKAAKAAANRKASLRSRMKYVFYCDTDVDYTGHELSVLLDARLNSVTPRFAELRDAGLIYDTGIRRNGQIAWKATQGELL